MALVTANSRLRRSVEGGSSATTTANSNSKSNLPQDLLIEILSRLPVKALIRFKSACRRWYDLISNPNFISTHLINNSTNKVRCDDDDDNFCGLKVVDFDVVNTRHLNSNYNYLHLDLNVDFDLKETPLDIVAYCDGIFCLSSSTLGNLFVTIVLHNPALRETTVLPPSHPYYPEDPWNHSYNVGFGFDQKTKDYKVVKMVSFKKSTEDVVASVNETHTVVEVYSLSTDSWRVDYNVVKDLDTNASSTMLIRDFPNGILCLYNTHFFRVDEVEVPFYIDDDMFSMHLRLPTSHYKFELRPFMSLHLAVVNGKLAFICSYMECKFVNGHLVNRNAWVEIWVMTTNSCDVKKQWSLVFTVESLPVVYKVLGFWNTNVLMVYDYGGSRPVLYDLVTKQYTDLQRCGELDFFYKESLVSVKRRTVEASEVAVQF